MIHFLCSSCQKALKAKDEDAGKRCICRCGEKNVIPSRQGIQKSSPPVEPPIKFQQDNLPPSPKVEMKEILSRPTQAVMPSKEKPAPVAATTQQGSEQPSSTPVKESQKQGSFLGFVLFVGGILGVLYFYFIFDTSVPVDADALGIRRVNNLGLMSDRQNGILISIGAVVVGALLRFRR